MGIRVSRNQRTFRKLLRCPKKGEGAIQVAHLAGRAGLVVRDKQRKLLQLVCMPCPVRPNIAVAVPRNTPVCAACEVVITTP